MKKKMVTILLASFVVCVFASCDTKEEIPQNSESTVTDDSLEKVSSTLSKTFDDVDVSSAETSEGKVLYITASEEMDSSKLGEEVGKIMNESWFDYDHIMMSQYIQNQFCVSSLIRSSDKQMAFHVWVDNDGNIVQEEELSTASTSEQTQDNNEPSKDVYGPGETWTVDGSWNFTINSVTSTDERNQFSDKNPAQVLIIDYSYENIGYEDELMDLYFSDNDMQVLDANGEIGSSYPNNVTNHPQEIPVGAKCMNAQQCVGINNQSSEITIHISQYDDNYTEHTATFVIPVS